VVKVQRPTARTDILQDLGLLELFAEKTQERSAFRQVIDLPTIIEHLSASLRRELDFRQEASNLERMHGVLASFSRLDAPRVFSEFSTDRLLTMEEIQGVPLREIPDGPARRDAARQLLESYYEQILAEGFFHADPHPGNMMWWHDRIYFLDLGMVGEVGADMREQLMLLLMAFSQQDVGFLTDVTLMLANAIERSDLDVDRFQSEIGALMARYRTSSLKDIQLGPILQEMTEISVRFGVPLPASLALTGKALAQMQLATAQLDPDLDPFEVAGKFLTRSLLRGMGARIDPKALFYQSQKLKVRAMRVVEAIERMIGARPGQKMEINFRAAPLEATVRRAGRQLALGLTAGAAILASGLTAMSARVSGWVPITFGILSGVLTLGLLLDLFRSRNR
jgi:predicted unusual protein kinase regulating ubiquinone biosynthesis (AarF/ABC1/UbiB family)